MYKSLQRVPLVHEDSDAPSPDAADSRPPLVAAGAVLEAALTEEEALEAAILQSQIDELERQQAIQDMKDKEPRTVKKERTEVLQGVVIDISDVE